MQAAQIIAEKDKKIEKLEQDFAALKHQYDQLLRLIYGSKSERFKPEAIAVSQLNLFASPCEAEVEEEKITTQVSYERKSKNHPGRNPLPEHLPVIEEVLEPEEDTSEMVKIGEQVSETLEYTPASLVKKRIIRPKYVNKEDDRHHIAPMPIRPLPKSIAEASLLSHIIIQKYSDHLPLYRQEKIFFRDFGWKVAQSTLVDWIKGCCDLLEPLYNILIQKVLESGYIQADESPIKVLERPKGKGNSPPAKNVKKVMRGYQWVYYDPINKLVYFNYRQGRGMHGPKEVLKEYKGYVQCDGYSVYDGIANKNQDIELIGCLVHARRYFDKALESDQRRASYVLEIIQKIYKAESLGKDMTINERHQIRTETIVPLLEQIEAYIHEEAIKVLPKSPIGKAMTYYQNHQEKIKKAAADVRFELDNNQIENSIRPLAVGRKNFLFGGSHDGAKRMAMMYSFIGSCKIQGINPREWLENTLKKIPEYPVNRIIELLPGFHEG